MDNKPAQRLTDYHVARSAVMNALDQAAIPRDFAERIGQATALAGQFAAGVTDRAAGQALYDLTTNIPTGIIGINDWTPKHAVNRGIVGAIGRHVDWDIVEALELCADILEDVNAHTESAQIRAMIDTL